MTEEERTGVTGYAVIEQMGHKRIAGYVREVEVAGAGFLLVDIPDVELQGDRYVPLGSIATQYVAPSSIYAITPCGEQEAFAIAAQCRPSPITEWDVRALLPEITETVKRQIEDEVRTEYWKKLENDRNRIAGTTTLRDEDDELEGSDYHDGEPF